MNNIRQRQFSAILIGLTALGLLATGTVRADANDGEYLGYRLGDKFSAPKDTVPVPHVAGPLIYELFTGTSDHGVDTMSLLVSPDSLIIGSIFGEWYFSGKRAASQFADRYLASLARKYREWTPKGRSLTNEGYQLSVEVQNKSDGNEGWPKGKDYRVAASLIYAPESLRRQEWMAIVNLEASNPSPTARQQNVTDKLSRRGEKCTKSGASDTCASLLIRPGKSRSAWSW